METRLKHIYEDSFALFTEMTVCLNRVRADLDVHASDMEYCADVAFAMAELDKLFKDIGVATRKTRELAEKLACKTWMTVDLTGEPIRTDHCTATPDIKLQPRMPKKGTPEMKELLDWLGIDERSQAVVRIHWPTLCDMVTEKLTEGGKLPSCISPDKMHNPSAKLKFYKRKEVTE